MKILLFDDNPTLKSSIKKSRHSCIQAKTIPEIIRLVQSNDFHLLILDMDNPNGLRLCKQLNHDNINSIYILAKTVKSSGGNLQLFLDAGINDFLIAPTTIENLEARLRIAKERIDAKQHIITLKTQCVPRKESEKLLKKCEAKNRAILDAIADLMLLISKDGVILDYKATDKQQLLLSPEEFLFKDVSKFFPAQISTSIKRALNQIFQNYRPQLLEYHLEIKGISKDFEAQLIISSEDEALAIIKDITDRKQTEITIRKSEEQFRTLFELAPIGVAMTTINGNLIKVNQALCNTLGYSENELLSLSFNDLMDQDEDTDTRLFIQSTTSKKNITSFQAEKRFIHKNGNIIFGILKSTVVCDSTDEPMYYISQLLDITERKKTLKALRYRVEIEKIVSKVSSTFIDLPSLEIDNGIIKSLELIGNFTEVDRSFVYQASHNNKKFIKTHQWFAKGMKPPKNYKIMTPDEFPWWIEKLNKLESIHISDIREIEASAKSEKRILINQGIQSVVVVPLEYKGHLMGFIELDSVKNPKSWSEEDIFLLQFISQILVSALERKRTATAINRLASVIRQATEAVLITDLDGKIVYANPFFEESSGYSAQEAIGRKPSILKSGRHDEIFYKELWNHIKNGETWTGEFTNRRKDGSLFHEAATIFPIRDSSEKIINYAAVKRDITQRKQAEEWLRRLEKAVETMLLGVTITETSGKIIYTNPADARMHGYTVEELLGNDVRIFSPQELKRPMSFQQMKTSKGMIRDSINIRKDGTIFPVQLMSEIVKDPNGQPVAIVTLCEDITERKKAEKELKLFNERLEQKVKERTKELHEALQKEKELNELKSRFVSIVSHEFRTPLTTILSSSEIIERYSDKLSPERKVEHINRIKFSVAEMASLLNDVLFMGKVESGKLPFDPSDKDVEVLTKNLVDELRMTYNKCEIAYHSDGEEKMAFIDEKLLRHILTNLISNAIKYSPDECWVALKLKLENDSVIFEVSDKGIGIPEEDQRHLFEAFHRAKNVGNIHGTGLGLSIVKNCIDLHGGIIECNSKMGKGTTFTVTIPMQGNGGTDE